MGNNFSKSYVTLGNENRNDWILDSQRLWDRWEERHDSEEQSTANMILLRLRHWYCKQELTRLQSTRPYFRMKVQRHMKATIMRMIVHVVGPGAAREPPFYGGFAESSSVAESSESSSVAEPPTSQQVLEQFVPDAMYCAQFSALLCPDGHELHIESITVAARCGWWQCGVPIPLGSAAFFCKGCIAYLCVDCVEELAHDEENVNFVPDTGSLVDRALLRKLYRKALFT